MNYVRLTAAELISMLGTATCTRFGYICVVVRAFFAALSIMHRLSSGDMLRVRFDLLLLLLNNSVKNIIRVVVVELYM